MDVNEECSLKSYQCNFQHAHNTYKHNFVNNLGPSMPLGLITSLFIIQKQVKCHFYKHIINNIIHIKYEL